MTNNQYNATITEAAYLANIPDREIRRIIEDEILSTAFINMRKDRCFNLAACVLASFYFKSSEYLYKKCRILVIKKLLEKIPDLAEVSDSEVFRLQSENDETWKIHIEELSIDLGVFAQPTIERFEMLHQVASLEKIMDGEPILLGTRVPARTISFLVSNGISYKEIIEQYPSIPNYELFQSAKIWSDLNLYRLAPKKIADIPAEWKLISTIKVKFKKYEIFN